MKHLASLLALAGALCDQLSVAEKSARPNVLFIVIDDVRGWAGCLGHAQARTPNLDHASGWQFKCQAQFGRHFFGIARRLLLHCVSPSGCGMLLSPVRAARIRLKQRDTSGRLTKFL